VRNAEDGPKSGGGSSLGRKEWISAADAAMGKETSRKALLVSGRGAGSRRSYSEEEAKLRRG